MTHAERLRQLVRASGLSHAELARRIGVSRQAVHQIVRRDVDLSISRAGAILTALGKRWSDLDDLPPSASHDHCTAGQDDPPRAPI